MYRTFREKKNNVIFEILNITLRIYTISAYIRYIYAHTYIHHTWFIYLAFRQRCFRDAYALYLCIHTSTHIRIKATLRVTTYAHKKK
jgi:hypothetical protein